MTAQHMTGEFNEATRSRSLVSRLLLGITMALMAAVLSAGVSAQEVPIDARMITAVIAGFDRSTNAVHATVTPSAGPNWSRSSLTLPPNIDSDSKPKTEWIACGGGVCLYCYVDWWGVLRCGGIQY